jgi:hypothetical protein
VNEVVGMTSLDLSAAFDMVDIKLLVKRLPILELPGDVVDLIKLYPSMYALTGRTSL